MSDNSLGVSRPAMRTPHEPSLFRTHKAVMNGYAYAPRRGTRGHHRTYVGWIFALERRLSGHNSGAGAKSQRGWEWCLICQYAWPCDANGISSVIAACAGHWRNPHKVFLAQGGWPRAPERRGQYRSVAVEGTAEFLDPCEVPPVCGEWVGRPSSVFDALDGRLRHL